MAVSVRCVRAGEPAAVCQRLERDGLPLLRHRPDQAGPEARSRGGCRGNAGCRAGSAGTIPRCGNAVEMPVHDAAGRR